jgi:thiosulfate dehydrogenase (quinone) large subunit
VTPPDFGADQGWVIAAARVTVAFLWMSGAGWKVPPSFGETSGKGLYKFTSYAVDYPVFAPYSWLVEHVVLPHLQIFGWLTLLVEASLGAFLLVGLATRFWALVGIGQSLAIALSVLYAPHEWPWSYYLMILAHALLLVTHAGRVQGLDGVLAGQSARRFAMALAGLTVVVLPVFGWAEDSQVARFAAVTPVVAVVLLVVTAVGLTGALTGRSSMVALASGVAILAALGQLAELGRDVELLGGSGVAWAKRPPARPSSSS